MTTFQWIGAGLLAAVAFYILVRLATLAYFVSKRQAGANQKESNHGR